MAFLTGRAVLDHGEIGLLELAVEHQTGHAGECLAGLGKDYHTAHGTVQPMNDTTEDIARFVVAHLEECFYLLHQRGVTRLVALHNLARQLIEGYQVVVLI